MAKRVYIHVGLPKTGTTYLQSIVWANKDALREVGVLLPGFGPRQHLWASCVVRDEPNLQRRHSDAPVAWQALVTEVNSWPGTALISHEFFAGASEAQVRRALTDLDGAEVHVVVTAREIVGLITARWQEWVKNGAAGPIEEYPPSEDFDPADEWGWGTLDLADVLRRWGSTLPAAHVHVIPLPGRDQPKDALWVAFAEVLGLNPSIARTDTSEANESLGVVEVELLRRITPHLTDFTRPVDKGVWIRGYLAQGQLVPRAGERFWPSPTRVDQLRRRGEAGIDDIATQGYDVVGDLDSLRTPAELPQRRHPDDVTEQELLDAATQTIASMLGEVRTMKRETATVDRPTRASRASRPNLRAARKWAGRARNRLRRDR